MKRNVIVLTLLSATVLATAAFAINQPIDITARFRVGLAFANKVDMDFTPTSGHIDFYGAPDNTADFIQLGTDGNMASTTPSKLQPSALTGTPASVDITSDGTSAVDITCTATATLAEAGGDTVPVDNLQIDMNTGAAYGAAAYTCAGATTPFAYTLTGTDKIIMGGRLKPGATVTTADYSTATSGGTAASVDVIYH